MWFIIGMSIRIVIMLKIDRDVVGMVKFLIFNLCRYFGLKMWFVFVEM